MIAEKSGVSAVAETDVDPGESQAEVDRLRAEKGAPRATRRSTFWRTSGASTLIVLGVLLFTLAISASWLSHTIMDEDRWVATVAPLAQDPAIQDYVATEASSRFLKAVDVESYVKQALSPLPSETRGLLATPITDGVQNFAKDSAFRFARSPQFPQLWVSMNRLAHKAFIASINQTSGGTVSNKNGKVTLNVGSLIDEVKAEMTKKGLGFVNAIPLPVADRTVTLIDSPELGRLSAMIRILHDDAFILPALAVTFLAAGVALAPNRRKAVLWMGVGMVIVTAMPLQAIYLGRFPFTRAALQLGDMPAAAAQSAYNIVFRDLVNADQMWAFVGLVFLAGAVAIGPGTWPSALRAGIKNGLDEVWPQRGFGSFGEWIDGHRTAVLAAGPLGAVLVLLLMPPTSIASIVWLVVALLTYLLAVEVFGRPTSGTASLGSDRSR